MAEKDAAVGWLGIASQPLPTNVVNWGDPKSVANALKVIARSLERGEIRMTRCEYAEHGRDSRRLDLSWALKAPEAK